MRIRKTYLFIYLFAITMFIFMGTLTMSASAKEGDTDNISDGDLICVNDLVDRDSLTFTVSGGDVSSQQITEAKKVLDTSCTADGTIPAVSGGDAQSAVQWSMSEPVTLKGYAFHTANAASNHPARAPKTWKLYATNDNVSGECEWVLLDQVEDGKLEDVNNNSRSSTFQIQNTVAYQNYKLVLNNNIGNLKAQNYKFRELILYAEKETTGEEVLNIHYDVVNGQIDRTTLTGDAVHSSQTLENLVDTATGKKGLYNNEYKGQPKSLQWEMKEPVKLDGYAIVTDYGTTGQSALGTRDPWEWTFYGSNDPNGGWTVLSTVTESNLPMDRKTVSDVFVIEDTTEYKYFKFTITGNRAGNNDDTSDDGMFDYIYTDLLLLKETEETGVGEGTTPRTHLEYETDDTELRILLASDTHHTYLNEWYGVSSENRMQHWVDSILKEHAKNPFDLILLMGDYSLDYWVSGGSVPKDGISTTKTFIENYVSQLPDVPIFILPGNHELQSESVWYDMTGNYRSGTVLLGDILFVLPDTYSDSLDQVFKTDGVYTPIDAAWVKEMMDKYPNATEVYIVAHNINPNSESEEFAALVAGEDRIKGMFNGHSHKNEVERLQGAWGYKTTAETGQFAYTNGNDYTTDFWGFRELVIKKGAEAAAYSQYIVVESDAVIDNADVHIDYLTTDAVVYYGDVPGIEEEDPYESLSEYYKIVSDKVEQESISGTAGASEDEGVDAAFDNNIYSKYCVPVAVAEGDLERVIQWEMAEPVTLNAYAFVTANDMDGRDPWKWELFGSNDPDGEWISLSVVDNSNLSEEEQIPLKRNTVSNAYGIENPGEYQHYKLVITNNRSSFSKASNYLYQFSELILLEEKESGGAGEGGETGDDGETGEGGEAGTGGETGEGGGAGAGGETGDGGGDAAGGETGDGGGDAAGGETGDGGGDAAGGETGEGGGDAAGGETGESGEAAAGGETGDGGGDAAGESDTDDDTEDAASDNQEDTEAQEQESQNVHPTTGDSSLIGWWISVAIVAAGLIGILLRKDKVGRN